MPLRRVLVPTRRPRTALLLLLALVTAGCAGGDSGSGGSDEGSRGTAAASGSATTLAPLSPETCTTPAAVARWPVRRRLAQLLMVGVTTGDELERARRATVGGVFIPGTDDTLLTSGNLVDVTDSEEVPLIVSVDEEGGRVQRIDAIAGSIPSARDQAETMTVEEVRALATERGRALRELGVTMNLAPVVDVSTQADGEVIGDRAYGETPEQVTAYAGAFAAGLEDAGIAVVLKHFPGHGRAAGDSHESAATTPPLAELRTTDLVVYEQLIEPGRAVMVGHLTVPTLTEPGVPTSVSAQAITNLLRGQYGFDGLVMTDDLLSMRAISDDYDLPDAVTASLIAGADMALWVSAERIDEVLDGMQAAVEDGSYPEAQLNRSTERVVQAKADLGVDGYDPCRPVTAGS